MTIGGRVHCMFCLNPLACEIKQDRKGRPYLICSVCGMRAFCRTDLSLRGPQLIWGPLVRALHAGEVGAARIMLEDAAEKAKEGFADELKRDAQLVAK